MEESKFYQPMDSCPYVYKKSDWNQFRKLKATEWKKGVSYFNPY